VASWVKKIGGAENFQADDAISGQHLMKSCKFLTEKMPFLAQILDFWIRKISSNFSIAKYLGWVTAPVHSSLPRRHCIYHRSFHNVPDLRHKIQPQPGKHYALQKSVRQYSKSFLCTSKRRQCIFFHRETSVIPYRIISKYVTPIVLPLPTLINTLVLTCVLVLPTK